MFVVDVNVNVDVDVYVDFGGVCCLVCVVIWLFLIVWFLLVGGW